jgi:allantoate deiminase
MREQFVTEELLAEWLDKAASCSLPGKGVSRLFLTAEHKRLLGYLRPLMERCGLVTEMDDAGNLVARKPALHSAKTLYLGSHQDTVPSGGRYDGILGILVALLAVHELRMVELPFNVEVIAFGDEEGTRFNSTLLGSTAVAGCFDPHILDCTDNSGISLAEALRRFGLNPDNIPGITREKKEAIGYVEVHIEQGPVLEHHHLPVGLVSAMSGIERHMIKIIGTSGHAGTVPMHLRKDALVAAGHYVSWLDAYSKATEDLVGVVGKLDIHPNSVNVIPGSAELTLELRSPHGDTRRQARKELQKVTAKLIEQGFSVESEMVYSLEEVICDEELTGRLESALVKEGITPLRLFSGAGHDGLAMAHLCPVAMLFVRCRDGLSHHPDESIEIDDALKAKDILKHFIKDLASDF